MKFNYNLVPALIGVSIVFVQPQNAVAQSSAEVAKIAKQITVLIKSSNPGSGVIVKQEGNIYTVLTAYHVVSKTDTKYEIITADGQSNAVNYRTVKQLPDLDLAVVRFTSSQSYAVAKIGNSDASTEGTTAYVAGFPAPTAVIPDSIYSFTQGQITANASKPLKDGYALVYLNDTFPGMSGGPVLNEKGEVVGIHGEGETTNDLETYENNPKIARIKTGRNLGIPINNFLRLSAKVGVDVGVRAPEIKVAAAPKADDFFIQGLDKYKKQDYKGAVADWNEAIRLNPNYAVAYYNRGNARVNLGDKKGAIEDFNQALRINPNFAQAYNNRGSARLNLGDKKGAVEDYNQVLRIDPNYAQAYYNRGNVRSDLGDKKGAIEDFNQALRINPNLTDAYNNRGSARSDLGDKKGAIEDFNQALRINPNLNNAYYNRGNARSDLGDKKGAIEDFNQAIRLNPNDAQTYNNRGNARLNLGDKKTAIEDFNQALRINPKLAQAYNNRGNARLNLGDKKEAIEDYNQALRINPNYAQAYNNRGNARLNLGDNKGAIEDCNQALRINPNYADAYYNRGLARYSLGNKQSGITDLQKAAKLFRQQGNTESYQQVLDWIRKFQQ
jgi:tetratricopeptide (TPR) repeat protein